MPSAQCGFDDVPGGAPGAELLASYGPTLQVDIGFDANFQATQISPPVAGLKGIDALVDTGAAESCIDSLLAAQLNLPIVDRRPISGALGSGEANMHLAQIYIPGLNRTIYGVFAGVHLQAGGQAHKALIGRTFLQHCTLSYDGRGGKVSIQMPDATPPVPPPAPVSGPTA